MNSLQKYVGKQYGTKNQAFSALKNENHPGIAIFRGFFVPFRKIICTFARAYLLMYRETAMTDYLRSGRQSIKCLAQEATKIETCLTLIVGEHSLQEHEHTLNTMTMNKKYTVADEHVAGVSEDALAYPRTIGVADALWALITAQSQEVQEVIAERLNALVGTNASRPAYTAEELNARIDEAEAQMMSGDVLDGEAVHDSMRNYIKSMAC